MEEQVITIFCIVDDILKTLKIKDDPQTKMSSSEVLTTAIVHASSLVVTLENPYPSCLSSALMSLTKADSIEDSKGLTTIWKAYLKYL